MGIGMNTIFALISLYLPLILAAPRTDETIKPVFGMYGPEGTNYWNMLASDSALVTDKRAIDSLGHGNILKRDFSNGPIGEWDSLHKGASNWRIIEDRKRAGLDSLGRGNILRSLTQEHSSDSGLDSIHGVDGTIEGDEDKPIQLLTFNSIPTSSHFGRWYYRPSSYSTRSLDSLGRGHILKRSTRQG